MNTGLALAVTHPSFDAAYAAILQGMDHGVERASTSAGLARAPSTASMVRVPSTQAHVADPSGRVIAGDGVARRTAAVRDVLIEAADELLDLAAECVPRRAPDPTTPIFNLSLLASAVLAPCGRSAGRPFP